MVFSWKKKQYPQGGSKTSLLTVQDVIKRKDYPVDWFASKKEL